MRKIKLTSSYLLVLIGAIHTIFAFFEFDALTLEALWFVSGGLAFAFAGLFNLFVVYNDSQAKEKTFLLKVVNLLLILFLGIMLFQLPMMPGFIGLACATFLLFTNN